MVEKVRERLSGSKRAAQNFDMDRFNLKLNDVEDEERYEVKISNRFAAIENLDGDVDINRTWKSIIEV
jgi:hypothetical protein